MAVTIDSELLTFYDKLSSSIGSVSSTISDLNSKLSDLKSTNTTFSSEVSSNYQGDGKESALSSFSSINSKKTDINTILIAKVIIDNIILSIAKLIHKSIISFKKVSKEEYIRIWNIVKSSIVLNFKKATKDDIIALKTYKIISNISAFLILISHIIGLNFSLQSIFKKIGKAIIEIIAKTKPFIIFGSGFNEILLNSFLVEQ